MKLSDTDETWSFVESGEDNEEDADLEAMMRSTMAGVQDEKAQLGRTTGYPAEMLEGTNISSLLQGKSLKTQLEGNVPIWS